MQQSIFNSFKYRSTSLTSFFNGIIMLELTQKIYIFVSLLLLNILFLIFIIHLNIFPKLSKKFKGIPKLNINYSNICSTNYINLEEKVNQELDLYKISPNNLYTGNINRLIDFLIKRFCYFCKANDYMSNHVNIQDQLLYYIIEYLMSKHTYNMARKNRAMNKIEQIFTLLFTDFLTLLSDFVKLELSSYIDSLEFQRILIGLIFKYKCKQLPLLILKKITEKLSKETRYFCDNIFVFYKVELSKSVVNFLLSVIDDIYTARNTKLILRVIKKIADYVQE